MSGRWPRVPLGEVAEPVVRAIAPEPGTTYRFVGVKLWGEGAYEFARKLGSETAASILYEVKQDDIVINKIWARHGSVAVVPPELDGAVGSAEFPTFMVSARRLSPRWIHWWSKTKTAWDACGSSSFGSSGKNRIKPAEFLRISIPLPPLDEQRRIVARLDAVEQRIVERRRAAEAMEAELARLLAAAFRRITAGAPRARMGDVAPLVRRAVMIDPEASYTEIGVRSFFKGTFHRRTVSGADFTWQKLFRINEGDLIFSNLMAWEKGIALAGQADDGCVGNHRMLTCEADRSRLVPGFLWFYFTTDEGFAQVVAASPGTIARNKTLSAEELPTITVPLPSLDAQQWFDSLQRKARAAREAQAAAERDLDQLLPALLAEAFGSGETTLEGSAGPEDASDSSVSAETLARPDDGRAVRRVAT